MPKVSEEGRRALQEAMDKAKDKVEARQPRVIVSDPSNSKMVNYAGILGDAWELFERKSKDYTNSGGQVFEDSGLMGQFMKMRDKIAKLKKPLWDAEILRSASDLLANKGETGAADISWGESYDLEFEGSEEIMMDLIGHCILAISVLRNREEDDKPKESISTIVKTSTAYEKPEKCLASMTWEGITYNCCLDKGHSERLHSALEGGRQYQWKRDLNGDVSDFVENSKCTTHGCILPPEHGERHADAKGMYFK